MLNELREDNLKLVESLRAAKAAATEAGDNATEGIIDDWTDEAEERAWFLFEAGRNGCRESPPVVPEGVFSGSVPCSFAGRSPVPPSDLGSCPDRKTSGEGKRF